MTPGQSTPEALLAHLDWMVEMGADEAIGDVPVDRFALPDKAPWSKPGARKQAATPSAPRGDTAADTPVQAPPKEDPAKAASELAASCADLDALRVAVEGYDGCALKRGARNTIFADGVAGARVMVVADAPDRDEDQAGRPLAGRAGLLFDAMFAAIGLSRSADAPAAGLYLTSLLPWRPPQNRPPSPDEIAQMRPFLMRHIELAAPEVLILLGTPPVRTVLDTQAGVTRLRGQWTALGDLPVMPMRHPRALLRDTGLKRDAWEDLKAVRDRLAAGGAA
ncbi:uracil-DNA glycosylase [Oceanomicrobium pacificus]|uniref:Type-4 uracil-DNA glycosylase n=1 Tax=Oceanomicrobium pacificus TaxID=2692916 RepID=A0A6B0TQ46_9RHOB|nr:uracil-DNA glycosylase [Oceanomicrobium pacificus]MXU66800.1 uracil-DNA glycosylase [Oceanomicrobium pacificus]